MKNLKSLHITIVLAFFFIGCSPEEITVESYTDSKNFQNDNQINYPVRSKQELIISFKPNTSQITRAHLRSKYGVIDYETCNCTNQRIEKWEFRNGINVEERLGDIPDETEVEGVDYQYFYPSENHTPNLTHEDVDLSLISTLLVSTDDRVNIAVLDTGIDLNNLPNTTPFLYNSTSNSNVCTENNYTEISGWDFVNQDNNPFDDKGHGTIVTKQIMRRLQGHGIGNYSILPVKVFDHLGKATTFNLLCGYLYTVSKPNIHMINMSFGWYGAPSELLNLYINENAHIVHITSAGNKEIDNDATLHNPSSIPENHVLAIGSYREIVTRNGIVIEKSSFSNYGPSTVDYLSRGEGIFFEDNNGVSYPITGTSYAAPIVTAEVARYYTMGYHTTNSMIDKLWQNATLTTSPMLPVYYGDRIIE